MRILLDECIPKKPGPFLSGHDVTTVVSAGWKGMKNGELLARMSADFDVFISVDRNIAFQQNLKNLPLLALLFGAENIAYFLCYPDDPEKL